MSHIKYATQNGYRNFMLAFEAIEPTLDHENLRKEVISLLREVSSMIDFKIELSTLINVRTSDSNFNIQTINKKLNNSSVKKKIRWVVSEVHQHLEAKRTLIKKNFDLKYEHGYFKEEWYLRTDKPFPLD